MRSAVCTFFVGYINSRYTAAAAALILPPPLMFAIGPDVYKRQVDKDHRVLVQLDRKTRAVHGKDDLTARLEVLADF